MMKPLDPVSNVKDIKGWLDTYNITYKSNTRKPDLIKLMNDYYDLKQNEKESEITKMDENGTKNDVMSQEDIKRQADLNKMLANIDDLISEATTYINTNVNDDFILKPGFTQVNEDPDIYKKNSDVDVERSGMSINTIKDAIYEDVSEKEVVMTDIKSENIDFTEIDKEESNSENDTSAPLDINVKKNDLKNSLNSKITNKHIMIALLSSIAVILVVVLYMFFK